MVRIIKIVAVIAVLAVAAGCCRCKRSSRTAEPFTGTEWVLVRLMGQDIKAADGTFRLNFSAEGRVTGRGACNSIFGEYTLPGDGRIDLSHLGSTRMLCPDMAGENEFFAVVSGATSYEIDGQMLMLFRDGEMQAVFQAVK